MRRPGPTSLPGQIALLVAVALFVAQALNFALLLRERRAFRFAEITLPAVTRLIDAAERTTAPRPAPARDRMRGVRLVTDRMPALRGEPERDVEQAIRAGFADAGIRPGRIAARIRPIDEAEIQERGIGGQRAERLRRMGAVLDAAVELPGRGWLVSHTPWPMAERGLLWQSLAQTFIQQHHGLIECDSVPGRTDFTLMIPLP